MKLILIIWINLWILAISLNSMACTSFCVSGQETWYGMNFDYPEIDIRFAISETNGQKIFRAYFGSSGYICGMNDKGLFTNYQMLYYNNDSPTFQTTANSLDFSSLNNYALKNLKSVDEIMAYIGQKIIIRSWNQDLHTLFADSAGHAIIVEPYGSNNGIVPEKNNFLVMTNLPHYDFINSDYTTVFGVGADRYNSAYQYIRDNISNFRYENAFETLKRTVQPSGYPTLVSLIFNPAKKEIFFCLNRDFSKVWKISLTYKTLETYSGFSENKTESLNSTGVWASALLKYTGFNSPLLSDPETAVRISRNQTKNELIITVNHNTNETSHLSVYNIQGTCLEEGLHFDERNTIMLDLTGYPKGIYFLQITSNGNRYLNKICLE